MDALTQNSVTLLLSMPKRLTEDQIIAKHLRKWVEDSDKSICQLGREIGVNHDSLGRSLKGLRAIRLIEVIKLCWSLGMTLDVLDKVEEDLLQ